MTTPQRIALVHPYHWEDVRRGGERYFADLAGYLADRGHQVEVVTGTWDAPVLTRSDGVTVRRLKHRLPHRVATAGVSAVDTFGVVAWRVLRRERYDVVHALTPTTAIAARLAGQRTVFTALGFPTVEQFGVRPFDRRLTAIGLRAAHVRTAFSAAAARQVEELFGRGCVVVPLGVHCERFAPRLEPRTGPPRLLFAGFPGDPRKGVDLALQAMPGVLNVHPDARLLLPGEASHHARFHAALGRDRDRVVAAIDDIGVAAFEEMPQRYRDATVALLPSRWEALGISLAESLACGTPVVCSDDGGMPSIVNDPRVGTVVTPGDASALRDGLIHTIRLAGEPATPAACVRHARHWDWPTQVGPEHEELYAAVVDSAGHEGRDCR